MLLRRLAAGTRRDPVVERVLFALVANRALAPSSKLAATGMVWVENRGTSAAKATLRTTFDQVHRLSGSAWLRHQRRNAAS